MIETFFTVASDARRISLENTPENLAHLKHSLGKWERELKKADPLVVGEATLVHWSELRRISHTLKSLNDSFMTGFHDRIFKNILKLPKAMPSDLAMIFGDFIEGVTYFHDRTNTVPVYHRLFSCGPGDDGFRKSFQQCTREMDKDRRMDVKKRIETCYIERLIFDHMYRMLTLHFPPVGTEDHAQDEGHLFRLELTKADFKTCFPKIDIEVDIEYDGMWPIVLTISKFERGNLVYKETYSKSIYISGYLGRKSYDPIVEVVRRTKARAFHKIQRFDFKGPWKQLKI